MLPLGAELLKLPKGVSYNDIAVKPSPYYNPDSAEKILRHDLELDKESDSHFHFVSLYKIADSKMFLLNKRITHEIKVSRHLGLKNPLLSRDNKLMASIGDCMLRTKRRRDNLRKCIRSLRFRRRCQRPSGRSLLL